MITCFRLENLILIRTNLINLSEEIKEREYGRTMSFYLHIKWLQHCYNIARYSNTVQRRALRFSRLLDLLNFWRAVIIMFLLQTTDKRRSNFNYISSQQNGRTYVAIYM